MNADFRIRIDSTGDVFDVPSEKSILNVLHENGYAVDHTCTSGLCGACKVRYLGGEPDHRDLILTESEHDEYLTVCISRCASGELLLDLPPPGTDGPITAPEKPLAIVNQDICVACLTCVRACTYGAAAIDAELVGVGGIMGAANIDQERCSGCGLCAAACPTGAISMTRFSDSEVIGQVTTFANRQASEPLIVVFACPHCGPMVTEYQGTSASGEPIDLEIIDVPCTGRIDNLHIMRTFEDGADAVIVSGCEPGRCYHSTGNLNAAKRTDRVRDWLTQVGLGADRLRMVHLPPLDGAAPFAAAAKAMIHSLQSMGPNPLRVCSESSTVDGNVSETLSKEDALLAELGLL